MNFGIEILLQIIIAQMPESASEILDVLWESLLDLDELASSTASMLRLLANMLATWTGLLNTTRR